LSRLVDLVVRQPDIAVAGVIGVEIPSSITAVRAGLGRWWRAVRSVVSKVVLGVVLGVGVAGVVRVWVFDRGFWNDELYIAVNLKAKTLVGLAGPLIHLQTAPPGWMASEQVIYRLFGGQERLFNVPQLLAAVAVLVLTAIIACQAAGRWAALIATTLVAGSPLVYYYAGELKQYEMEAASCLVIILAAGLLGRTALAGAMTGKVAAIAGVVRLTATALSYNALIVCRPLGKHDHFWLRGRFELSRQACCSPISEYRCGRIGGRSVPERTPAVSGSNCAGHRVVSSATAPFRKVLDKSTVLRFAPRRSACSRCVPVKRASLRSAPDRSPARTFA